MPKLIHFARVIVDHGVERFHPEKVYNVRAAALDSRFMSTHGKLCILADDNFFVTHVGRELGDSARFYAWKKLGWDFTRYDPPKKLIEDGMMEAPKETVSEPVQEEAPIPLVPADFTEMITVNEVGTGTMGQYPADGPEIQYNTEPEEGIVRKMTIIDDKSASSEDPIEEEPEDQSKPKKKRGGKK